MELDATKEHAKKIEWMMDDRPKLYGLMMQHMSVESKDEVTQNLDCPSWHVEKDPEKFWQAIVRTHISW